MKKYFELLKQCSLMQEIDVSDFSALLSCLDAKIETYDKKQTIFAEGTPAASLGIVLSGSLQISQVDFLGNRTIVSGIFPSDVFAESFACAGVSSLPVSVIANEKSEVMLIDCHRVIHACSCACSFHQQIILNLMKDLALKNIAFHKKLEITSRRSTREKLMTYLMMEAKKHKSREFFIPFDRQELADYLEVERSGLSSEIGKLRKEGLLESEKNHFILL